MKSVPHRNPGPTPITDSREVRDQRHATQLLNACMTYARLILGRYGQLAPFAFSMDREGQIAREVLDIPRLPRDPARLWKLLSDHVADRIRRGRLQGVALCAYVTLAEPSAEGYTDAVILTIEQESGHALQVTVPSKIYGGQIRNLLPRRVALGKTEAEEIDPQLFASGGPRPATGF
ncbi:MAG: hypothetical protein WCC27_00745 [Acidobacteriaceae bacterium]